MNNNNNNSNLGSGSFGTIKKAKNFKYDRHTNNTLSNNESIFKIFNTKASMNARASGKNYLKKEYNKYNKLKLKSIDPEQKYFIGIPYKYEILNKNSNYIKSKNSIKNKLNKSNKTKKYGLKYLYGGKSLKQLLINDYDDKLYKDYLNKLQNIFEGVKKLHKNEIYHFDIKPDNIVYDGKVMRLIDFDGSIKFTDNFYSNNSNSNSNNSNSNSNSNSNNSNSKSIKQITKPKTLMQALSFVGKYARTSYPNYCPPEFYCQNEKYNKLKEENKENIENNSAQLFDKNDYDIGSFDIWCLGLVLFDIYNQITNNYLKTKLLRLILTLLNKNYNMRPKANQALEMYKNFLLEIN
jgi:serine/threonine protein kinase